MSASFLRRTLLPLLVTLGTLLILGASKASAQTCPGKHGIAYVARDCDCDGQPDVLWPTYTSSVEPCDGCNMDLCDYCCPFECLTQADICSGCCCVASNGAPCDPRKGAPKLLPDQGKAFKPINNLGSQGQGQRPDKKNDGVKKPAAPDPPPSSEKKGQGGR